MKVNVYIDPHSDIWSIETMAEIDGQLFRDQYANMDNLLPRKYVVGKALEKFGLYIQNWTRPRCEKCGQALGG